MGFHPMLVSVALLTLGEGSAAGGGGEAVAEHDCTEGFGVGRAAGGGLEDGGDLAEVVGAEDAGGDDGEGSSGQARQGAPRGEVGYMLRTTSGRWTMPRGMTRESPGAVSWRWGSPSAVQRVRVSEPSRA